MFNAQLIDLGVTKVVLAGFVVQFMTQIYESAPDLSLTTDSECPALKNGIYHPKPLT
jgi:hypothetical protein